jgi:hypothetical protein
MGIHEFMTAHEDSSQFRIVNDEFRPVCCDRSIRFMNRMIPNSESIPGSENPESTETELRIQIMHDGRPRAADRGCRTVDLTIKIPSKRGVTLAWRHSLGGYARPKENFMCYFCLAPGGFSQLVQSGPSLEETAVYFRSTTDYAPNTSSSMQHPTLAPCWALRARGADTDLRHGTWPRPSHPSPSPATRASNHRSSTVAR